MFATLFRYPSVINRHRNSPAADERQRFLIHRANQGVARGTLLRNARELLAVARNINITTRGKTANRYEDPFDKEIAFKWRAEQASL